MEEGQFKWRLKVFLWFIVTEPFRLIKDLFLDIFYGFTKKSPSKTMMIFYLILLLLTIYAKNRFASMICILALIFLILRHIYKSGVDIHRWREVRNKRLNIGGKKNG